MDHVILEDINVRIAWVRRNLPKPDEPGHSEGLAELAALDAEAKTNGFIRRFDGTYALDTL